MRAFIDTNPWAYRLAAITVVRSTGSN